MGDISDPGMSYVPRSVTFETGGTWPLAPPTTVPFLGNATSMNVGTGGWDYPNPFIRTPMTGTLPEGRGPTMTVPWSAAINTASSEYLMKQITAHSLQRSMRENFVTRDMRTNHVIPYARPQNSERDGLDMYKGYVEGFATFLFNDREFGSPYGPFDPDATMYLTNGRPMGITLGDTHESYFRERPWAGFSNNYTLPQVNFLLACISVEEMDDEEKEKSDELFPEHSLNLDKESISKMFTFDGIMYNQEGGENPYNGMEMDPGKGIIYNIAREGCHRNTRNCWSNDVVNLSKLWFICKKVDISNIKYRLNPNDTRYYKPHLPETIVASLTKEQNTFYNKHKAKLVWQFIPWTHKIKQRPDAKDLMYRDEFGIKQRGFAIEVGYSRYGSATISPDVILTAKHDSFSYINCEGLEIYIESDQKIIM